MGGTEQTSPGTITEYDGGCVGNTSFEVTYFGHHPYNGKVTRYHEDQTLGSKRNIFYVTHTVSQDQESRRLAAENRAPRASALSRYLIGLAVIVAVFCVLYVVLLRVSNRKQTL